LEPKALFGVVTRSAGLFCMVYGLWVFAFGIGEVIQIFEPSAFDSEIILPLEYIVSGLFWLGIGAFLLLQSDAIVNLSYREHSAVSDGTDT
jgi:hypothetical protein